MSGRADTTLPVVKRPRKSTGHSPVRKRIEKENITVDMASSLAGNAGRKKLRSKSIGPGGLDGLKSGAGNRRVSLAAPSKPPPRSILKPTIPILPEIPPHKPRGKSIDKSQNDTPTTSGTKVALRTEEEQQAAAREREEREMALEKEKEIKDRREARRKSLANRRVSFAAEATLHTFHEIEYMKDTAASNTSARGASSSHSQGQEDDDGPPSTPPDQVEDVVPGSPDDQREMHQKKNRGSSAGPLMYSHNDEDTMASTVYDSDSDMNEEPIEADEVDSDSGSDSDADGVSVDLDVEEVTGTTVASLASAMSRHSDFTAGSTDTLEGALRLATNRAVTQSLDEDEEIIPSFGWVKKPPPKTAATTSVQTGVPSQNDDQTLDNVDATMDLGSEMDLTRPIGGIIGNDNDADDSDQDAEMSMDVTRALGGIVSGSLRSGDDDLLPGSPESEQDGEATMELTMAVGGIKHQPRLSEGDLLEFDDNEEMSMELTTVLGKVLPSKRKSLLRKRRISTVDDEDVTMDMTMDMTTGLGRILDDRNGDNNALDEATGDMDMDMDMDMTMAIGGIISDVPVVTSRSQAKHMMEQEVNEGDATTPDISSGAKRRLSEAVNPASATRAKSPGRNTQGFQPFGQSLGAPPSSSPFKSSPFREQPVSPVRRSPQKVVQATTPSKSLSPRKPLSQPGTANRTIAASPRRTPTSISKPKLPLSAHKPTPISRIMSPLVVLTPQQRRLSGLGADRAGLGSPRVAEMFDRRESLGQTAEAFVPRESIGPHRGVAFTDPQIMAQEFDREIHGDDENITATLRDNIASMTPKKNPFNGRKSLAVGSAAGLLGKRPLELDDDDEDDEDFEPIDGVKRLKNHQGSPVKNIRLGAPPTRAETWSNSVNSTMTFSPKKKIPLATSPKSRKYLNFVESDLPTGTLSFEHTLRMHNEDIEENDDDDGSRIHLQDFLNMTSIRFMELTTIKHLPSRGAQATRDSFVPNKDDVSLQRRVVAGACTVPMLELYQHSCRELKKYISEGRRIMREIETETLEENPPLFQEYMNATPDFKLIMDNQFKNVKTHARLLSKAMWYEWRSQLQEGLKEGLIRIGEGMDNDEKLLNKEQKLLDSVLPSLQKQLDTLESEHRDLRLAADELADCDPEDLDAARDELEGLGDDVATKMAKIEALQAQLAATELSLVDCTERRAQCLSDIEESEKIREECRGWTSSEISVLKAEVVNLEQIYGWAITGFVGNTVSMTYLKEIELVFDVSAIEGRQSSAQVDLWYIAASRELNPVPSTPDREFFLQCIRDYVRSAVQARSKMSELLPIVSRSWDKAIEVSHNLRILNSTFPTTVSRTSDSSVAVRTSLLIAPLQTKVEISLDLRGRACPTGLDVSITPAARVVYGEHFKVDKVSDYLSTNLGTNLSSSTATAAQPGLAQGVGSWSNVVVDLHQRLLARGRK